MQNIVSYFNYFTQVIFGVDLLLTPSNYLTNLLGYWNSSMNLSEEFAFSLFLGKCISNVQFVFSSFVWVWLAWLTIHLLLIWPFKWIRSVVNRCKG